MLSNLYRFRFVTFKFRQNTKDGISHYDYRDIRFPPGSLENFFIAPSFTAEESNDATRLDFTPALSSSFFFVGTSFLAAGTNDVKGFLENFYIATRFAAPDSTDGKPL